jgi:YhgE/Pip-like protein
MTMSAHETDTHNASPEPNRRVRASELLRARKLWLAPLLIASTFIALISAIYIGSVVNPTGHLHGLPVMLVNEDRGAVVHGRRVDVGASLTSGLQSSAALMSRLKLQPATLTQARTRMDKAGAYATVLIPARLTRSLLLAAGVQTPGSPPPPQAKVELQENPRLGNLGVNLAAGVIAPAIAQISPRVGKQLSGLAAPQVHANPVLAAQLENPIVLVTTTYRPLPDHSALGLSAFYIALLSILSGFIGATLINSSIDSALGYATSEIGPRWQQRRPVAISRRQTFLTKWAVAAIVVPVLTAILVLVAVGALGMHAPHVFLLWLLATLAALMIATGTLALLAAFGAVGQLLAMILLVYLSLASSGGTVPIQALPGVFNVVGHVEPLRQVLTGTRAILYFGARGDAGLTHSLVVIASELVFWAAVGLAIASWYDRRKLDRISPDILSYIGQAIDRRPQSADAAEEEAQTRPEDPITGIDGRPSRRGPRTEAL